MGKLQTEWLYLTSYNLWSFCTILRPPQKDGIEQQPCLVFSPITQVGGEDSDMDVFQAFLALLICENDELEGVVDPSLVEVTRSFPLISPTVDLFEENGSGYSSHTLKVSLNVTSLSLTDHFEAILKLN